MPGVLAQALREPVRTEGTVPVVGTVRSTLASYWGDQWPSIEAALLEQNLDLEASFEFPEWESVAQNFEPLFELSDEQIEKYRESHVQWPLELSVDWLSQKFPGEASGTMPLGPRELAEIESLTQDLNAELYRDFDEYIDGQRRALNQSWYGGAFVKAPFATYGVPKLKSERAFYAASRAGEGWSVRVQLYESDHPEIMELKRKLRTQRAQRNALVSQYLAAH